MGSIGDTISQPIPVVGTSGTAYATQVNAFLEEVKARLEAAIPLSSILFGDLDLQNNALLNASYISLVNRGTAPTTPTGSFHNFGGNAYWVGLSGAVQITDGPNLNVAATGGITGDYGGVNPAQFRFVDADKIYYAYDNFAASELGYLRAFGVDITASNVSANRVRLGFNGGASYALTFPAAVPASTSLLQMSNAGVMTASNTLATNANLTLTGTGTLKYGNHTRAVPFEKSTGKVVTGSAYTVNAGATIGITVPGSAVHYFALEGVNTGDQIQSIQIFGAGSANAVTYALHTNSATAFNAVAGATISTTAASPTITPSVPAPAATAPYYLSISTGAASVVLHRYVITWSRP